MYKEREKKKAFQVICVTDRKSCKGDFLQQVEAIAAAGVAAILYRDKELSADQYNKEAEKIKAICQRHHVSFIRHGDIPRNLDQSVHFPERVLEEIAIASKLQHPVVLPKVFGASVHSVESAMAAERLGATYITAGHIFNTSCKPGLKPRGEAFLRQVAAAVDIPVYGIGGITPENIAKIKQWGGAGACIMSSFMETSNPLQLMNEISRSIAD